MYIIVPFKIDLHEEDLIALTIDNKFIGYAEVRALLGEFVLLNIDNNIKKAFAKLIDRNTPFDITI